MSLSRLPGNYYQYLLGFGPPRQSWLGTRNQRSQGPGIARSHGVTLEQGALTTVADSFTKSSAVLHQSSEIRGRVISSEQSLYTSDPAAACGFCGFWRQCKTAAPRESGLCCYLVGPPGCDHILAHAAPGALGQISSPSPVWVTWIIKLLQTPLLFS